MSQVHEINGELFKLRREERGLTQSDMATRACMSIKQIRQIEEGGVSAFYSESVKVSAAKKVAGLLGFAPEQIWVAPLIAESHELDEVVHVEQALESNSVVHDHSPSGHEETPEHHADEPAPQSEVHASVPESEVVQAKPKTSLWLIAGLFAAALAVAAYMRPDADPVATEPPPPLQVVPAEAAEPASSASAAAEAASADASAALAPIAPAVTANKPVIASPVASAAKSVASAALPVSANSPARSASAGSAPVASSTGK